MTRLRNLILAGVTAASLIPAAASAQSWGYDTYGRQGGYDRGYRGDDRRGGGDLIAREERLTQWMRRGSQEGWLTGWRARRAWEELRSIREDTRRVTYGNGGFYGQGAYRDIYRRLERLTDFVRDSRRDGDDDDRRDDYRR